MVFRSTVIQMMSKLSCLIFSTVFKYFYIINFTDKNVIWIILQPLKFFISLFILCYKNSDTKKNASPQLRVSQRTGMCFGCFTMSEECKIESGVDVRCYTAPTWEKSWKWVKGSKILMQLSMLVCGSRNILSLKIFTFLMGIKIWRKWKWGQVGSKVFHINFSWVFHCNEFNPYLHKQNPTVTAASSSHESSVSRWFETSVQVTVTNNVHALVLEELKFWLKSLKNSFFATINTKHLEAS